MGSLLAMGYIIWWVYIYIIQATNIINGEWMDNWLIIVMDNYVPTKTSYFGDDGNYFFVWNLWVFWYFRMMKIYILRVTSAFFMVKVAFVCEEIHVLGEAEHHCLSFMLLFDAFRSQEKQQHGSLFLNLVLECNLMILHDKRPPRPCVYPIVNQLKHLELRLARCSGSQEACHFAEAEITIHGSKYEAVGITLRPCQGHLVALGPSSVHASGRGESLERPSERKIR